MAMLTSAIVSEGYAAVKQGFEREAEERARAFCDLTGAQDRTQQSVEELQRQLATVGEEVGRVRTAVTLASSTNNLNLNLNPSPSPNPNPNPNPSPNPDPNPNPNPNPP